MQELKYIIKAIPPSNNRYIGQDKKWEYQNAKKHWAKIIYFVCRDKPPKPLKKAVITITYFFKDRIRRDPDNYSGKMILDGLVKAGIIEDDSFNNIELLIKGCYDKNDPRTEITIKPIQEEEF